MKEKNSCCAVNMELWFAPTAKESQVPHPPLSLYSDVSIMKKSECLRTQLKWSRTQQDQDGFWIMQFDTEKHGYTFSSG